MKRRHKNLIQLAILAALSLLVILSVFVREISWPERNQRRLEISVIFREWDSGTWTETRRGMEKAAADFGAELRFLTLQQADSVSEQRQLAEQELKNGADGLVLVPAADSVLEETSPKYRNIPRVTLESVVQEKGLPVTPDNQQIGKMLAEAAAEDFPEGGVALLPDSVAGNSGITQRLKAAEETLSNAGFSILRCGESDRWAELSEKADFAIVMETAAADQLLRLLDEQQQKLPVYAAGYSQDVLSGLENGTVAAAAVWSGYGMGYQAVQQAVCAIFGDSATRPEIPVVLVRREDMYEAENQKILFPIGN